MTIAFDRPFSLSAATALEFRRHVRSAKNEAGMRSELLAQARAASAVVESENEELRARVDSLATDIAALQDVLQVRRD